jgi:hypothetical protein
MRGLSFWTGQVATVMPVSPLATRHTGSTGIRVTVTALHARVLSS